MNQVSTTKDITLVTSGAGTAYPSGAPEFTSVSLVSRNCLPPLVEQELPTLSGAVHPRFLVGFVLLDL